MTIGQPGSTDSQEAPPNALEGHRDASPSERKQSAPAAAGPALRVHQENLQIAGSKEAVVEIVRLAMADLAGIGRGAVYEIAEGLDLSSIGQFEGPAAAELSAPEMELVGIARRALREGAAVRQAGRAPGDLWAVPLKSPGGIVGVVAGVGMAEGLHELFAHAGLALAREIARGGSSAEPVANASAEELERAVEILDHIAREGGTERVLRRITGALTGVPEIARASLWTLRPEDGVYIEVSKAENGQTFPTQLLPPEEGRRGEDFRSWIESLPRFGGFAWLPGNGEAHVNPGPGDVFVVELPGTDSHHPLGYVLAEVASQLEDFVTVDGLKRWRDIGRLALESRSEERQSLRSLEELRDEKEQISELHRMKSQFIAAVSHELRTPLTSITAYAETLRSREIPMEHETHEKFLSVICDESRRLTRIVDDILDLATMDAGRVRISCRLIDLQGVIADALDIIRPLAEEKGIHIEAPDTEAAEVHADPDLMKQLVVNLLENGVKFTGAGGHVRIEIERNASATRLIIHDDGPGIPAEKLDAVFQRFYQVDGSNARQHGGSGLGLAICRSIATWHDGRIWAESETGKGARFIVSLPRTRATSRTRAQHPVLDSDETEEHRIPELIIEMISEVMCAETVSLMLIDTAGSELFIQAAMGLPDETIRQARVSVGDRIAGSVAESGQTLFIPDLDADDRFEPSQDRDQYRTPSLISVPVLLNGVTIGVINVTNKTTGESFSQHDRRLLEILAERVALALGKLRELGDSRQDMFDMEEAIRGVIDVRRHYYSTGARYSDLVFAICADLGLDADDAAKIHYASILRDVGMTRLPEGVYKKPSELSHEDQELVRRHPEEGARVLRSIEAESGIFEIILSHHEAPSGEGYPRGLTDADIPMGSKVLAVVDAYHSLRSKRPYRRPVDAITAIEELKANSGKQFDPAVVDALVRVLRRREGPGRRPGESREPGGPNDSKKRPEMKEEPEGSVYLRTGDER